MKRFEIYINNSYRGTYYSLDEASVKIDFLNDNPDILHRDRIKVIELPLKFGE